MEWTNELITKLVKLIELHPCLWNPQHPNKKNRHRVNDAFEEISSMLGVEEYEVRKKKESLFQTYRHIRRKIAGSEKSGNDEVYTPSWPPFEALHEFLAPIYRAKDSSSQSYFMQDSMEAPDLHNSSSSDSQTNQFRISSTEDQNAPKRIKLTTTTLDNNINSQRKITPTTSSSMISINPSSNSVNNEKVITTWSQLMINRLKQFDEYTREFLMNQIDNYMFRAKMKQIKRNKQHQQQQQNQQIQQSERNDDDEQTNRLFVRSYKSKKEPLFVDVASTSKNITITTNNHSDHIVSDLSPAAVSRSPSLIGVKEDIVTESEEEIV